MQFSVRVIPDELSTFSGEDILRAKKETHEKIDNLGRMIQARWAPGEPSPTPGMDLAELMEALNRYKSLLDRLLGSLDEEILRRLNRAIDSE